MSHDRSHRAKQELLDHLLSLVQELSAEKVVEVIDFVEELKRIPEQPRPERGSLDAISLTLNTYGPLQFEPGELEALLTEIYAMRELDLDKNDENFLRMFDS